MSICVCRYAPELIKKGDREWKKQMLGIHFVAFVKCVYLYNKLSTSCFFVCIDESMW